MKKILKKVKYGFDAVALALFLGGVKIYYMLGGKITEVEDAKYRCGMYDKDEDDENAKHHPDK